ncbi:P-loop containing nucleoside triphosphate hydrolase protein [Pelagophyceae sp. CCMP2097]|nr:P-loop containing nucleoside triphosphate hydrolase protein [Pelagophyceae sp. CCMP2097]
MVLRASLLNAGLRRLGSVSGLVARPVAQRHTLARAALSTQTSTDEVAAPAFADSAAAAAFTIDDEFAVPEPAADEEPDGVHPWSISLKATIAPAQVKALSARGIKKFTDIQAESFDAAYEGRDLLGKSRTGTGKTLAFGLPIIEKLAERARTGDYDSRRRGRGPAMVVLAPTRELAKQVETELNTLCAVHKLSTACFHGGVSYIPQERSLRDGIDVLVATVGRVIDHLERGTLDLSESYHMVLDEADEMLSMGFADDVERIFSYAPAGRRIGAPVPSSAATPRPPPPRPASADDFASELFEGGAKPAAPAPVRRPQTMLFSATSPTWVKRLTQKYLDNPVYVDVVGTGVQQAATTVTHKAVLVPRSNEARASLLEDIITVEVSRRRGQGDDDAVAGGGRVIVFTSTKKECDELAGGNAFSALSAQVLHGDIGQAQRETTLAQFRRGGFDVLVATDVAARGIDVRGVDLVVQYRTPRDAEGYVHRSGRTGRAGRDGTAVVLYDDKDEYELKSLERQTGVKFERVGPPSPTAVMTAAANDATLALKKVAPDVLPYFEAVAAQLLAKECSAGAVLDEALAAKLVAKCLAAISRKHSVTARSLLSGESGVLTMVMTAPRDLRSTDVVYAVTKLLERLPEGDIASPRRVGAVRVSKVATTAVFDLPTDVAAALLAFCSSQNFERFTFTECVTLPELEPSFDDRRSGGRSSGGYQGRNPSSGGGGGYQGRNSDGRGGGGRSSSGGGYQGRNERRPTFGSLNLFVGAMRAAAVGVLRDGDGGCGN